MDTAPTGTIRLIESQALAELHTLLEDARTLLLDCSAIGVLDMGWRARRTTLLSRMAVAGAPDQAALSDQQEAHA